MNWCGSGDCEDRLGEYKATIRCIPLDDEAAQSTGDCAVCGQAGQHMVYVAKAY